MWPLPIIISPLLVDMKLPWMIVFIDAVSAITIGNMKNCSYAAPNAVPLRFKRLIVPVVCVRCITDLQPVVSGTQLLRKWGPVRVVLQLFLLVQHDGQRELDVLLLSELTSYCFPDRFVFSSEE